MNANREIFPLAFGVVDSENGDSWTWFLQLVATNIIPPRRNVCIISDRHVAIDCAFRNVPQLGTPLIQRRYCLRHIRSNFMSQFRSKNLKKLCWRAGSTPILNEFTNYMQQIRGANERAFNYLDAIPKEKWALCFDGGCRYGILTTNLSESFNHALKGCRTLPITALVRATFDKSVQLFVERRNAGMMWNQSGYQFPEKIRKQIMDGWQQRRHTVVIPHNYHSGVFSVAIENATPVTVDFSRSNCDCGCWRMNWMSCSYVHAVCLFLDRPVNQLIPEVYKLTSYINAHAGDIMPLPNMNEWPDIGIHLLPPKYLSRTSRVGRRQETRFQNEMDMRPSRRRGQQ
ncbi:unnamed protein product [Cuscuta epithymum]|uniref:MULE transposase domain-containing protein n=1 Tax=Cuscuta epithymum TaxID=186058 RepID=A0AAV0FPQ9_9ASTE|nr:unnamed protein product [Cuscuta epithymum]